MASTYRPGARFIPDHSGCQLLLRGVQEEAGRSRGVRGGAIVDCRAKTSIVASSETLVPLAQVLANDIFQLSGIQLNASTTAGVGTAGDITLTLIPSETAWHGAAHLAPDAEKYSVTIDGRGAAISCHTYTGCAWGVTTLLQTMCISGVAYQTAAFPSYNLTDWPDVP